MAENLKEKLKDLNSLIYQTQNITYHLFAIIGKDKKKQERIIDYLTDKGWQVVDVEEEYIKLKKEYENEIKNKVDMRSKLKEWFMNMPDKLILLNGNILYLDDLTKISPIEAFKYNTRGKNSVIIFLEDEKKVGNRLYYGELGHENYYDKEIRDINLVSIEEISDDLESHEDTISTIDSSLEYDVDNLPENAIGRYFNFKKIIDVVDIDTLKTEDRKKQIVSSYIFSDKLEEQVSEFFDDLVKPVHKARNIIGNYGSGKSHLVAMLTSIVENPKLSEFVNSNKIKAQLKTYNRKFYTVYFELQSGPVELRRWFYDKCKSQLANKYDIHIKEFDLEKDYDDKVNIEYIIEEIKEKDPSAGLFVAIDEISDFLSMKNKEPMKQDLQFLRVIGQVAQENDFMFVGSMQEDIFSSSMFKETANEISRVRERFQNIIIVKEDIEKVISERIVSKTSEQKHQLEEKFKPFLSKIDDVSNNLDRYIDLFPLTPTLIEMFNSLPFFEKRGVTQFAISEIKKILDKPFPFLLTFEKIYDIIAIDPNKKNLQEVSDYIRVSSMLFDKIKSTVDKKYQEDAIKIVKGLVVSSLRDTNERGATAKELANKLMLLPHNDTFSSEDYVSLVIKKIREASDGQYIKIRDDKSTGYKYITLDTKLGIDPDEKINQKIDTVSDDEIEQELFRQLEKLLDLEDNNYKNIPDVFEDECEWKSKKSFRKGYILFNKKDNILPQNLEKRDYEIVFISPYCDKNVTPVADNQLQIKISINTEENVYALRKIAAIRQLYNLNFQKTIMEKKLDEEINGYRKDGVIHTGFAHRLSKIIVNSGSFILNGENISTRHHFSTKDAGLYETLEEIKTSLFDSLFNKKYPLHPMYPFKLSSSNIVKTLDNHLNELLKGDFNKLQQNTIHFLESLKLLDENKYPSISDSPVAEFIINIIKDKAEQAVKIDDGIVKPLTEGEYGLEKEVVYFILSLTTLLGKTILQAKGGKSINIDNIKDELGSLSAFENILYVKLEKNQSYDTAAKLLNAFGLNGDGILNERTRMSAFIAYKEKVANILNSIKSIHEVYGTLQSRFDLYINLDEVSNEIELINEIDWKEFDLANSNQFYKLKSYERDIAKIKNLCKKIEDVEGALNEYLQIKPDIEYVHNAKDLIEKNEFIVTNTQIKNKIIELHDNIIRECGNFSSFMDRVSRNAVKGKINQFKSIYKKDIYYPAHENYVGSKVDWKSLSELLYNKNNKTFQRLNLLSKLKCINDVRFRELTSKVRELISFMCENERIFDELDSYVFCQKCLFPKDNINYSLILSEINKIADEFENLLQQYEKNTLKHIREYRDNIKFLDKDSEKQLINGIMKNEKLPETLDTDAVNTINKLFREISVVSIKEDEFRNKIFPGEEIFTVEEIEGNFNKFLLDLLDGKDTSNIRIKLERGK